MKTFSVALGFGLFLSGCSEPENSPVERPTGPRIEKCIEKIPSGPGFPNILEVEETVLRGSYGASSDSPNRMTHMVKIFYGEAGTPPGPERGLQLCYFNGDIDVSFDPESPMVQEAADAVEDELDY